MMAESPTSKATRIYIQLEVDIDAISNQPTNENICKSFIDPVQTVHVFHITLVNKYKWFKYTGGRVALTAVCLQCVILSRSDCESWVACDGATHPCHRILFLPLGFIAADKGILLLSSIIYVVDCMTFFRCNAAAGLPGEEVSEGFIAISASWK